MIPPSPPGKPLRAIAAQRLTRSALGCLAVLAVGSAGCSAAPAPQLVPERRVGEEPQAGEVVQRRVGESLYTKFDYRVTEARSLLSGYSRGYLMGQIHVPQGAPLAGRPKRDGGFEYCTVEQAYTGPGGPSLVCFSGPPSLAYFTHVRVPPLKYGAWTTLESHLTFETSEVMLGEGFKVELLYQGVAGDILRLSYREFQESLARPAFQQDLTYTLSPDGPTEIHFRTLALDVISADNSGIRYRVKHGLY